jgi:hypothetical protein
MRALPGRIRKKAGDPYFNAASQEVRGRPEEHHRDPQSRESVSSEKKESSKLLKVKKHVNHFNTVIDKEIVKELHGVDLRSC